MRRLYSKEDIIENRMISVMYREDPKDSPVHTHDFLEIIYIIEGRAIHNCKGKQTPITKGNYFLIDYNSEHQIVCKSRDFKVITCTFVPEFIDDSLWGCGGIIAVFKNYNIKTKHCQIKSDSLNLSLLSLFEFYYCNAAITFAVCAKVEFFYQFMSFQI